jgi:putative salt-induced outer membrane protein YdiY
MSKNVSSPLLNPNNNVMKLITFIASILLILPLLSSATSIKLLTGDEINGEIIEQTGSYLKIKHDVLGDLTIHLDKITAIDNKPVQPINVTTADLIEKESRDYGLFGFGILPNWDRSLTIGLNGKKGNSQLIDFHVAFDGDYKDGDKRWDFGIDYDFNEDNGKKTEDDLEVHLTRDWLHSASDWFYFATGKYEQDKFKSWDYRLTGIVGAGYQFIETDDFSLIGRTGIAGKKNYGGEHDNFEPELMFGAETDWTISKIQSLAFKTEFFMPFERASDYRNVSKLDWKFKLDSSMDLSFKLGLENEYETVINDGDKHNDFKYRADFVWGL